MRGQPAKLISKTNLRRALAAVRVTRHPARNRVMILLSVKAGLRACEIAGLTWPMVSDASGRVARSIEMPPRIAKCGSGRRIPMHDELRAALRRLQRKRGASPFVVASERGAAMSAQSIVNWFAALYGDLGLDGCSSHSGRRTFVTEAARLVHRAGGSLRDVQLLAGHRSIQTTQSYIDGDSRAQQRLVRLL